MTSQPGLPPATGGAPRRGAGAPTAPARLRRRRRDDAPGLRLPRLRRAPRAACCSPGLPPLVRVNVRGSNAGIWLEASVRYALAEARSPRPGGAGVLAKLVRGAVHRGAAPVHERAGRGPHRLARRRGRPHRRRGAERAAHAARRTPGRSRSWRATAGTSRSVLAERFQHLVGSSPMQYLTQWRMLLAANLLSPQQRAARAHRRGRRLPDRHRVQPRVPARVRHAAGGMATPAHGTAGARRRATVVIGAGADQGALMRVTPDRVST